MKLKGIGQGRHRTCAETEPDFYRMRPVGPGDKVDPIASYSLQPNLSAPPLAHPGANTSDRNSMNLFQLVNQNSNVTTGASADLSNLIHLSNQMVSNADQLDHQHKNSDYTNASAFFLSNIFQTTGDNFGQTRNDEVQNTSNANANLAYLFQGNDPSTNFAMSSLLQQYMPENSANSNSGANITRNGNILHSPAINSVESPPWSNTTNYGAFQPEFSSQTNHSRDSGDDTARRMSAAALASLLSGHDNTAGNQNQQQSRGHSRNNSNSNLLFSPNFQSTSSSHQQSLNHNLPVHGNDHSSDAHYALGRLSTSAATMPFSQENVDGSNSNVNNSYSNRNSAANQQYSFLSNASAGNMALFSDFMMNRGSGGGSTSNSGGGFNIGNTNPAFLDSVYEPIPIKEDNTQNNAQYKLPGQANMPQQKGSVSQKGFHNPLGDS